MVSINRQPKILIAESDRELLASLQSRLEDNGFDVTAVSDGRDALKAALSMDFDLIIASMAMPAIKDFDFIHVFRRLKPFPHTPVILTGVLNDADHLRIAATMHVTEYLQKPFDMSVLLGKIDLLLEQESLCLHTDSF